MIHKYDPVKDRGISVPIGIPADNVRLYILDKHHKLVPVGVAGELCVAGDARPGYLNRLELTSRVLLTTLINRVKEYIRQVILPGGIMMG